MKTVLALLFAASAVSAEKFADGESLFEQFKEKFSKSYSDAKEELKRFKIFLKNIEQVEKLKMQDPTASYSVLTPFADIEAEEFSKRNGFDYSVNARMEQEQSLKTFQALNTVGLPSKYDARDEGYVTAVKNQGQCGSCWAFSTVANIEGQNAKVNGKLEEFSEQELVDCSKSDNGCQGGLPVNACKDLIAEGMGLEFETAYSYKGVSGSCKAKKSLEKVFLSGYKTISTNEDQIAAALVQYGTLSIGINASPMQLYSGGISNPFFCPSSGIDHGVAIVGYGTEDSTPFWVIKNSWGTTWGEKGYYRIVKGKGKCGLNQMVSTALVAKKSSEESEARLFI